MLRGCNDRNLICFRQLLVRFCASDSKKSFVKRKSPNYWNNKENILTFVGELKQILNLRTKEDWDLLTTKQIHINGGSRLLMKHSILEIKCIGFPEGKSYFELPKNKKKPKKEKKPDGYWDKDENILNFLKELSIKLNLKTIDDWNSITAKQIKLNGGGSLLLKYSLYDLKCLGFPDGKLLFDKPNNKKTHGYWEKEENIHNFLCKLKQTLNLQTKEDWNQLTSKQVNLLGGGSLFVKYSLYDIKRMGFPDGNELFLKKVIKPSGYWDKEDNVRLFLNELKEKLNLNSINDWNQLTSKQVNLAGGGSLLVKYSLYDLKCMGFPDGKEIFAKQMVKPPGYWNDKENIQNFINKLKNKFSLHSIEDWNKISIQQIKSMGGGQLFDTYSIYDIKLLGCPEGKFIFSKSNPYKPVGYWENIENIKEFIDLLKEKYNINSSEDWNRISRSQIYDSGGRGLLKMKNLDPCFFDNIPELYYLFNSKFNHKFSSRSSQRWLFLQIQKLFPGEEIVEDYFHSELSRQTGCTIQFDIFIVKYNIAFEYHGKHHYEDIPSAFATLEMYKCRDNEKIDLCEKFGIHLVTIPYWWDNKMDSLKNTILHVLENSKQQMDPLILIKIKELLKNYFSNKLLNYYVFDLYLYFCKGAFFRFWIEMAELIQSKLHGKNQDSLVSSIIAVKFL